MASLTKEQAGKMDALARELETRVTEIVGKKVDMLFITHPSHEGGEPCTGVIITTTMGPEGALMSIMQAGITMDAVMRDRMYKMDMEASNDSSSKVH